MANWTGWRDAVGIVNNAVKKANDSWQALERDLDSAVGARATTLEAQNAANQKSHTEALTTINESIQHSDEEGTNSGLATSTNSSSRSDDKSQSTTVQADSAEKLESEHSSSLNDTLDLENKQATYDSRLGDQNQSNDDNTAGSVSTAALMQSAPNGTGTQVNDTSTNSKSEHSVETTETTTPQKAARPVTNGNVAGSIPTHPSNSASASPSTLNNSPENKMSPRELNRSPQKQITSPENDQDLTTKYIALRDRFKQATEVIGKLRTSREKLLHRLQTQQTTEPDSSTNNTTTLEAKIVRLENEIKKTSSDCNAAQSRAKMFEQRANQAEAECKEHTERIDAIMAEATELSRKQNKQETTIRELRRLNSQLESAAEKSAAELQAALLRMETLEQERNTARKEITQLQREQSSSSGSLASSQKQTTALQHQLQTAQDEISQLQSQKSEIEQDLIEACQNQHAAMQELEEGETERQALQQKVEQYANKCNQLTQELSDAKQQNKSLQHSLKLAKKKSDHALTQARENQSHMRQQIEQLQQQLIEYEQGAVLEFQYDNDDSKVTSPQHQNSKLDDKISPRSQEDIDDDLHPFDAAILRDKDKNNRERNTTGQQEKQDQSRNALAQYAHLQQKLQRKQDEWFSERMQLEDTIASLRNKNAEQATRIQQLRSEISETSHKQQNSESKLQQVSNELSECKQKLDEVTAVKTECEQELKRVRSQCEVAQKTLEQLKQTLTEQKNENKQIHLQLKNERNRFASEIAQFQNQLKLVESSSHRSTDNGRSPTDQFTETTPDKISLQDQTVMLPENDDEKRSVLLRRNKMQLESLQSELMHVQQQKQNLEIRLGEIESATTVDALEEQKALQAKFDVLLDLLGEREEEIDLLQEELSNVKSAFQAQLESLLPANH